jgi:hypothetical protein
LRSSADPRLINDLDRASRRGDLVRLEIRHAGSGELPDLPLEGGAAITVLRAKLLDDPQPPLEDSLHVQGGDHEHGDGHLAILSWAQERMWHEDTQYGAIASLADRQACYRDIHCSLISTMGRRRTTEERAHERSVTWQAYPPNRRLWDRRARATYWANVLTPSMVEEMGGLEVAMAEAPAWRVEPLPGGRLYIQLSERFPEHDDSDYLDDLARLQEWMRPILLPPPPDWFQLGPDWPSETAKS